MKIDKGGYNWGDFVDRYRRCFDLVNLDILGTTGPNVLKICMHTQNAKISVHTKFQPNPFSGSQDIEIYEIETSTISIYEIASIIPAYMFYFDETQSSIGPDISKLVCS